MEGHVYVLSGSSNSPGQGPEHLLRFLDHPAQHIGRRTNSVNRAANLPGIKSQRLKLADGVPQRTVRAVAVNWMAVLFGDHLPREVVRSVAEQIVGMGVGD